MIKEILFVHNSGIALITRSYDGSQTFARDIIGSFISALGLLSQETFHDDLREIKFTNNKIIFKQEPYFCVTAIVDHEDNTEEIGDILFELARKFEEMYGDIQFLDHSRGKNKYLPFIEFMDEFISPFMDFDIQSKKFIENIATAEPLLHVDDFIQSYIKKREEVNKIKRKK